ncbi:MAG: hypothetical protein OER74_18285, partial [Desulfobacteraceae bacterium]|nr:hypothetical protein [Desulfobacteraceae bacterium]
SLEKGNTAGTKKGTVSEVITVLEFFSKSKTYPPLSDCELIAAIYNLTEVWVAQFNIQFRT